MKNVLQKLSAVLGDQRARFVPQRAIIILYPVSYNAHRSPPPF
ncbi:hypothetical protein ACFQ21_03660 [Ohtaekwangia kribbensis]|uniref:Uncharacterized protein n=1 Tax=Ohtaekwangia kribbensis TaxID=688913 RepID=A0ABW3JX12_9BACT